MKCDLCQEKATVFYTQVIDGKLKKSCLCETCAEAEGVTSPDGLLMPGELFGEKKLPPSPLDLLEEAKEQPTECPNCGFTLESLKRVGRLGCSKCYETFADEIEQRLPSLHKGVSHTGYFPEGLVKLHELKSELEELNARLDEAIAEENYEEAASLRDKIRALKQKEEGLVPS
jgi:protein arginine kinase activator